MAGDLRAALRIRRNLRAAQPRPGVVHLNLTGRCPGRCWHCEKAGCSDGRDMPAPALEQALGLAETFGCRVSLAGGEPLAHRRWQAVVAAAAARTRGVDLFTGGWRLDRLHAADRALLAEAVDQLFISLDGATAAVHDRLRGIDGLFAAATAYLTAGPRPRQAWIVHVPPPDCAGLPDMIDLAADLGCGLVVQPLIFVSSFPDLPPAPLKAPLRSRLPQVADTARRHVEVAAVHARRRGLPHNLDEVAASIGPYCAHADDGTWFAAHTLPRFRCSVPWQQVTVDEQGRLQPCVFLPAADGPAGEPTAGNWWRLATDYRRRLAAGETWEACRSCSCHFGVNWRNSIVMHPWVNRRGLAALVRKRLAVQRFGHRQEA